MHYGIRDIPTVAMFAPGEAPKAAVGFRPLEALEAAFDLPSLSNGAASSDSATA